MWNRFAAVLRFAASVVYKTPFFFSLSEIGDRGGSTETFLKKVTLSVLARAYPCKLKISNGNFKNILILPG